MPAFRPPVVLLSLVFAFAAQTAWAAGVRGRVVDPAGLPSPGVRVLVTTPLATVASTDTSADGTFVLADLPPGEYELRVAAEGFRAEPIALTLADGEERAIEVRLRLSAIAEAVIVSASAVDTPLSRAPDSVTVATAADIRLRQLETAADALRTIPGMIVARNGGRGTLTSLLPRGGDSDYTLVMIDGVRVNAFGGGFDFAHLPAEEIARIEVVRGPQSALQGSDAIGGIVHLITRRGGAPWAGGLFEAGGTGTVRSSASTSGSAARWRWGGSAERIVSDGFEGLSRSGERVTNDDYRSTTGSAGGAWRAPRVEIAATLRGGSNERGFPGPYGADPGGTFQGVDRVSRGVTDTWGAGVNGSKLFGSFAQRAQVTFADLDGEFTSPFGVSETGTRRLTLRTQSDFQLHRALGLSGGVEWHRERFDSTFITDSRFEPIPMRRTVAGFFSEARYAPRSRLLLTAGLRVERIHRDPVPADELPADPRPAFSAETIVSANPKVTVSYLLGGSGATRWTRLRGSAGTGIRPPDGYELAFTNNPRLQPERSRSADFGVEQGFAGGAVIVDAAAFVNRYDDLIVSIGPSLRDASRYSTDNVSNARARGLELGAAARTRRGLRVRASYTWMDARILAADGVPDEAPAPYRPGDRLIRRPRHQGSITASYAGRRVSGFGEIIARGGVLDVDPSFGAFGGVFEAPGYTVVNAGAEFLAWRGISVHARVLNLAGERYEEALGFPAPGRSGMIGVRIATRP
jgi:outer membrane cobalamin receptor